MACDEEEAGPSTTAMQLATRGDHGELYPDCCLVVTTVLLDAVKNVLADAAELVLSVGCGSGRFEALLLESTDLNIVGIEVSVSINKHLPPHRFVAVEGTHALYAEAIMATVLMFVYPRPTSLVARYVKDVAGGALQKVVVLTHRNEWIDVQSSLDKLSISYALVELPGTSSHEIGVAFSFT